MNIKLYKNFYKRKNSTKIPDSSIQNTNRNVALKENTSLYAPVFILNNITNAETFTYLQYRNLYYYVTDLRFLNNDHIQLECTLDHLASFKNNILSSTAFVKYSSSNYHTYLPDSRFSMKSAPTYSKNQSDSLYGGAYYAVTHSGNDGSIMFAVRKGELDLLLNLLYTDDFMTELLFKPVGDWGDYVTKKFQNIDECISSVVELATVPTLGSAFNIHLGNYNTGIAAYSIIPVDNEHTVTLSIPWQFDDFRNRSGYTSILLHLPGYGTTELNADDYYGINTITIKYIQSNCTGVIEYIVDGKYKYSANCGIKIPYGTSSAGSAGGILGAGASAAAIGAGIATGGATAFVGGLAGLFNSVGSSMIRNSGTTGGSGTGIFMNPYIEITTISHDIVQSRSETLATMGAPLNEVINLSALSGYVECADFHVNSIAPDSIKELINNDLNGGIYIE